MLLSLKIDDKGLRNNLLLEIVNQIDSGQDGLNTMLANGLDPAMLERLRRLPARDLLRVVNMPQLEIKVGFSTASVLACLDQVEAERRGAVLFEYFVAQGAPIDVVQQLFRVSKEEVRALRKQFDDATGVSNRSGRPSLPPLTKRQQVHEDWAKVQCEFVAASLRERYYQLHQLHQDLSMAEMLNTINEFKRDSSDTRAVPPSELRSAAITRARQAQASPGKPTALGLIGTAPNPSRTDQPPQPPSFTSGVPT